MIHSGTESSPASGAHAHQYVFPHVHFGIGPFKHSVYIDILTRNEIRHNKRYDSFPSARFCSASRLKAAAIA